MKISNDVMNVLARCSTGGVVLYLPPEQLDRKLYTEVNKVIEALGGKWHRASKGHVFEGDAADMLESVLLTGEYSRTKQDFGQFDTPPDVVARVMELSEIENFGTAPFVLEPSIGLGNIAAAAEAAGASVAGIEVDAKRLHAAKDRLTLALGIKLVDFLAQAPTPIFDLVLMNPPFAKQADIDHVTHALKYVKPGGRLVAIMSAAVLYRDNEKARKFRELIEQQATGMWEELDAGAFKASGTMVRACIVAVDVRDSIADQFAGLDAALDELRKPL